MHRGDLIEAVWDGQAFIPRGNWSTDQCHKRLGAGQIVHLDIDPSRSRASHNHQFSFVATALENMPEHLLVHPFAKNAETLRKHALISCGYCDTSMLAVGSPERAERVGAFVNRMAQAAHGYAITNIEGSVVYCHTPKSQSEKAMGKSDFQQSKKAIGEWLADLLGVDPEQLMKAKAA